MVLPNFPRAPVAHIQPTPPYLTIQLLYCAFNSSTAHSTPLLRIGEDCQSQPFVLVTTVMVPLRLPLMIRLDFFLVTSTNLLIPLHPNHHFIYQDSQIISCW